MNVLRKWWQFFLLVVLRRQAQTAAPEVPEVSPLLTPFVPPLPDPPAKPDIVPLLAMDIIPPPDQPPIGLPPPVRPKWAKPKGLERLAHRPKPEQIEKPKVPRKPRTPRPDTKPDADPEQWGQYYFRNAILDQLDNYFIYLKRMRHHAKDAYDLHRQLGIQIMPQSAVQAFDNWRSEGDMHAVSAWWREHRPGFGAIAYGMDRNSMAVEAMSFADLSPEQWESIGGAYDNPRTRGLHRQVTFTSGEPLLLPSGEKVRSLIMWVPKFLYFYKYQRTPPDVQSISDGDVYCMTVYWDRLDGHSKGFEKRNKGGVPQEYAVCVDHAGEVRVLRQLISDPVLLKGRHGGRRGESFAIPHKHWSIPTKHLNWAVGRLDHSPEDYLRRCFLEAALMYESAALGSMIRVEIVKGDMTATFGVDSKRTAYFFKDRDITAQALTSSGTRAPIFHSVRPHVRHTKTGEHGVRMHFRGLREFQWAGYRVSITVPGRDHFILPEVDIGSVSLPEGKKIPKGFVGMDVVGKVLADKLKREREGNGIAAKPQADADDRGRGK
jgi:hypothetical protein